MIWHLVGFGAPPGFTVCGLQFAIVYENGRAVDVPNHPRHTWDVDAATCPTCLEPVRALEVERALSDEGARWRCFSCNYVWTMPAAGRAVCCPSCRDTRIGGPYP